MALTLWIAAVIALAAVALRFAPDQVRRLARSRGSWAPLDV